MPRYVIGAEGSGNVPVGQVENEGKNRTPIAENNGGHFQILPLIQTHLIPVHLSGIAVLRQAGWTSRTT